MSRSWGVEGDSLGGNDVAICQVVACLEFEKLNYPFLVILIPLVDKGTPQAVKMLIYFLKVCMFLRCLLKDSL